MFVVKSKIRSIAYKTTTCAYRGPIYLRFYQFNVKILRRNEQEINVPDPFYVPCMLHKIEFENVRLEIVENKTVQFFFLFSFVRTIRL